MGTLTVEGRFEHVERRQLCPDLVDHHGLLTDYDGYHLVLEVDYRYMRDASLLHPGLSHGDRDYEHHWLFLELMTAESAEPAAPTVDTGSFVSPTMARLDMGNGVFVAYDRRAREDTDTLPRVAPVTGLWACMDTGGCIVPYFRKPR